MSTAREQIFEETASKLAEWQPAMVDHISELKGNWRTRLVDAAKIDGVEGIVHVVEKRGKFFAMFTSDAELRERFGR